MAAVTDMSVVHDLEKPAYSVISMLCILSIKYENDIFDPTLSCRIQERKITRSNNSGKGGTNIQHQPFDDL
jgi:hypothetical protein